MLAFIKHTAYRCPANRSLGFLVNFRKAGLVGVFIFLIGSNHNIIGQTTLTYSSSGTFVVPAGVTSISVECWGGGGAGGSATGNPAAGGGGSGGAYVKNINIPVTPGLTYTVTVGAGGVGSTTTAGGSGGFSWFGSTSTILAVGGAGGALASLNNSTAAGAAAVTTGNVGGTTNFYGGAGGTGGANGISGGGGGGSAGTGSNGNAATGSTGGIAVTSGGVGASGSTTIADGQGGGTPGGGGSGGHAGNSTDRAGGSGGSGKVIITYICPTYSITQIQTAAYICSGTSTSVQVTETAAGLPVGTYTVNYTLSGANAGSYNTTMTVATAGSGIFTASNLNTNGTTNITVTSLVSGGCNSSVSSSCSIIKGTLAVSLLKRGSDGGKCGVFVAGNPIYCPDGTEAVYSWEYLDKQGTNTWTPIAGSGRDFYPVSQDDATKLRYRRTATCGSCTSIDNLPNPIPGYMAITAAATSTCFGLNNGTATVTVNTASLGIPPYNYTWRTNPGGLIVSQTNVSASSTNTATGLQAGTYTVSVQDQADQTGPKCTSTVDVIVEVNTTTSGTIDGSQPVICSGLDPLAFTSTIAGSGSPSGGTLTYQWQSSTDNNTWNNVGTGATYDAPVLTTPAGISTTYSYKRITNYLYQGTTCSATSNVLTITVDPLATVTPVNSCIGAGSVTFTQTGGLPGGTWSVSGGGTINSATGEFTPTTAGCYSVSYKTLAANCIDTRSFVVFPKAPVISAPANSCNASFTLPVVPALAGFSVQYSIDGGAFSASPSVTTPGCHRIKARYVLSANCGTNLAGSFSTGICGESNEVNVVIYPAAPVITAPANTCNSAFELPQVPEISGFNIEYSIDGGTYSSIPSTTVSGCHRVTARYVLAVDCGSTLAGTPGTGACGSSNEVNVVIFPAAPEIEAPANTCNAAFSLPNVTAVSGFNVEYSIDGGTWATAPSTSTPDCHTIAARYVLASACGSTPALSIGSLTCGVSNTVNVVIFPAAPAAPEVNTGCGPIVVTPPASVSGFNIEYSFDNGANWGSNTPPTTDNCTGYSIKTRYVTSNVCGSTPALTSGIIAGCTESPATSRKVDQTLPVVKCNVVANQTVNVNSGLTYIHGSNSWDASATDNCSATAEISLTALLTGNTEGTGLTTLNGVSFNIGTTHVTWTATDACGNSSTCTFDVIVLGNADIQVVKTSPSSIDPGAVLSYTLVVTNNGPALAQKITLNDALPGGLENQEFSIDGSAYQSWTGSTTITNLASGNNTTVLIRGKVPCSATGSLTNTAMVELSTITDPDLTNNTSTVSTTINNLPELTTATSLCIGSTLNLSPSTGGTWISSDDAVATVTSGGVVTGVSAGPVRFTYTITATGCTVTTSDFTVISQPQGSLSANGPFCASGTGQLTWTATSGTGPFTIVYNDGTADRTVNNVSSGTPFDVSTNPVTSTTIYTLVSVSDANNCSRTKDFTAGSATIIIKALPTVYNVTGGGTICTGSSITVGLSGSQSGISYQLLVNSTSTGSPVNGTGSAISLGNQTIAGTYSVVATNTTTSCVQNMNGSAIVILNSINPGVIVKGALNPGPACDPLNPNNIGSTTSGSGSGVITYAWEQSTDGETTWQPALGSPASGNLTFNPDPMHVTTSIRRVAKSTLNGVDCIAYSNTLSYIVYPLPEVAYITPVGVTLNVCVNSQITIYNTTPGGVWTSGDNSIATVVGGVVTGVNAGDVVISYTVTNEHCSRTANRTVHVIALPSTSPIYHR